MKKWLLRIFILLVLLIGGFVVFVLVKSKQTFDAPFPEIIASTDSALIERGRHLAYGPAHCGTCHVPQDKTMEVEKGLQIPLSGGWMIDIPPGKFVAPNLTPDKETGIGKLTDKEIARTLRYSVGNDGRCLIGFMPFQGLSDEDLRAVISFLRSQPPVKHELPKTEYTFLGKAVMAFGLIKPEGPKETPPVSIKIDSTVEYGKYLANYVTNCVGCHTVRDMKSGAFTGVPFAGGMMMAREEILKNYGFVTPNLTPDAETGVMRDWNEQTFVSRFKAGRTFEYSPMPWGAFSRMDEVELKAIYRYLTSLPPTKMSVPKTIYKPEEKMPGE